MKMITPKTSESKFILFYSIYCSVIYIICYMLSLEYPLKIYDELMVVLIPPFAYAAIYYSRYIYIATLLIGTGFAILTILTTNTNISRSLVTLSFVFCIEFIVMEFLYRNACSQRTLINENIEINKKYEETFEKLVKFCEIIPICHVCNKLRTNEKAWKEFEVFMKNEMHADLVKGICEDCTNILVADLTNKDEQP